MAYALPAFLLVLFAFSARAQHQPTSSERWRYYLHRTYSPERLGLLGADSGLAYLLNDPGEWGRTPHSLAYRYAAGFGTRVVRNTAEFAAGAALGEDIRYRPSTARGFRARVLHAAAQAFVGRRAEGRGFAWSRAAGAAGGMLVSSAWSPRPLTAPRLFEAVAFGFVGQIENNLLSEFAGDMKSLGRRFRAKIQPGR
ncbi:MAG: hypothetical protein ACE15B_24170 [Bryobacteraceae bacterium]